jgi:hypothetical protein
MRRLLILAVLTIAALAVPSAAGAAQGRNFQATLTGAEEVPALSSAASGEAEFELNAQETTLRFTIQVEDITNAFMGHIHQGPKGANGEVIVWLFPRAANLVGPRFNGEFGFSGTVTAADLVGKRPEAPKTIKALAALLRSGGAYANVHTNLHPGGEIRGQISSED